MFRSRSFSVIANLSGTPEEPSVRCHDRRMKLNTVLAAFIASLAVPAVVLASAGTAVAELGVPP